MASNLTGNNSQANGAASPQADIHFAYFLSKPMIAWNPLLSGMHAWMCNCHSAQASLQQEWTGFVSRRLEQDVALPRKLSEVKAPEEAWHVCVQFFERAVEDYRTEYAELARLGTCFAGQAGKAAVDDATTGVPALAGAAGGQPARRSAETTAKVPAHADG